MQALATAVAGDDGREATLAISNAADAPCLAEKVWETRTGRIVTWLALLAVLLVAMAGADVGRTQEARVLETAREMIDTGWADGADAWLIPRLNGHVRLQKPPLAYWLTAASYAVFGVSTWSGRLPAALAAWGTVGIVFAIGRRLFSARAGFFAAAMLAGSLLFLRYGLLAETDVLTALLVTAAACCFVRLSEDLARWPAVLRWSHAAGVIIGLTALAKGPPVIYPLLMLVGVSLFLRRWSLAGRWLMSGAPLTALAVSLPWVLYAGSRLGWSVFLTEMRTAAEGGGHSGSVAEYIPDLLIGTLPWVLLVSVGIIAAIQRWRLPSARIVLAWCIAIGLPLALAGQKQKHYLMPLMPPLMLLGGFAVDQALRESEEFRRLLRGFVFATAMAAVLAAPGALLTGHRARGHINVLDVLLCAAVLAAGAAALWLHRHHFLASLLVLALSPPAIMGLAVGAWDATFSRTHIEGVGSELAAEFGDRPTVFYGGIEDVRLVFALRRVVPVITSKREMAEVWARRPDTIALVCTQDQPTPPPGGMVGRAPEDIGRRFLYVYERSP